MLAVEASPVKIKHVGEPTGGLPGKTRPRMPEAVSCSIERLRSNNPTMDMGERKMCPWTWRGKITRPQ